MREAERTAFRVVQATAEHAITTAAELAYHAGGGERATRLIVTAEEALDEVIAHLADLLRYDPPSAPDSPPAVT